MKYSEGEPCVLCPNPCTEKNYNPLNPDCEIWVVAWPELVKAIIEEHYEGDEIFNYPVDIPPKP
jgi:hypothetical protein